MELTTVAGSVSTAIFAASAMPMLVKAIRTRDLASYSPGNLLLANAGNLVHSLYVFSLPAGPIWALHSFYLITSALMLAMYLRFASRVHRLGAEHTTEMRHDYQPDHRGPLDRGRQRAGAGRR